MFLQAEEKQKTDKDNFVDVLEVNQEEYTSMPEYGKRVDILSETNKKLEEKEVVEEKEDKKNELEDQDDSKVCHLIFSFMLTLFKRRKQVKMRMKARKKKTVLVLVVFSISSEQESQE